MRRYGGLGGEPGFKAPSRKRKNAHPEHDAQCLVVEWARLNETKWPELKLLFAVPNGARVAMRTAVKLKREGMKAGVPDLWLPVPKLIGWQGDADRYAGLVIEMKAERGRVSPEQFGWLVALKERGWWTAVCRSAEEAIEVLTTYVNGRVQ